jgi:hypothetical protein
VFYRLATNEIVVLRNAQGISEIGKTLYVDLEAFGRAQEVPRSIGVVLDSDDEDGDQRFGKLKATLESVQLVAPPSLGTVSEGTPRVGAFALPEPGVAGTLEDVLLSLGDVAYPRSPRPRAATWPTGVWSPTKISRTPSGRSSGSPPVPRRRRSAR